MVLTPTATCMHVWACRAGFRPACVGALTVSTCVRRLFCTRSSRTRATLSGRGVCSRRREEWPVPRVAEIDLARAVLLALLCALGAALLPAFARAQQFAVEPYLQRATPTSMRVQWETDAAGPGSVEWGRTRQLG